MSKGYGGERKVGGRKEVFLGGVLGGLGCGGGGGGGGQSRN